MSVEPGQVATARRPITASSEVQRRCLLCNGVLLFDDTGELLPDGQVIDPVMRRVKREAA
ncbi:DUF5999 family protein [Streptomyces gilvosporeus]|uniref:Uncharacterized protein n=1 Tax=Streptomyces gilvosporeus TaxID=553510 RepID=A0A1V0TJV2_9ACTN|nr:DUF5999 family protein [Streptomyces gilvosporeus]ARF53204.1 hypothetical protein B1H19_02590 [Streptomyces gilvosporeus]